MFLEIVTPRYHLSLTCPKLGTAHNALPRPPNTLRNGLLFPHVFGDRKYSLFRAGLLVADKRETTLKMFSKN